jgi:signal transduction histidine kinase
MTTDDPILDSAISSDELRELLARRDVQLADLAARVSHTRHELNNLLTGVLGQAQLILMREELPANARRRLETLEELTKRMRDVVAELNDI